MDKYKYLYDRPRIDNAGSEKLMDFEEVLGRAESARRYRFVRNTALVALAASAFVVFLAFLWQSKNAPKSSAKGMVLPETSTSQNDNVPNGVAKTPAPEEKRQKIQAIAPGPTMNAREEKTGAPKASKTQGRTGDDHFKIKETMPEKRVFVQAVPADGFDHLMEYFNNNTLYPDSIKSRKIQGKVLVEFTVLGNGKIGDVHVEQKIYPVLDSIAVATVRNMPAWQPASINGEPVATKHTVPLVFELENK